MRWQPPYALRVAALLVLGASCQAAFIGSGLGTWGTGGLEFVAGICARRAHPVRSLSRVSSYDYLSSNGVIPLGNLPSVRSLPRGSQSA